MRNVENKPSLRSLQNQYKKVQEGHRRGIYLFMCDVFRAVKYAKSSPSRLSSHCKSIGLEDRFKNKSGRVVLATMKSAMSAKSRRAGQLASKRANVILYLARKKLSQKEMLSHLLKYGVEKLSRKAAAAANKTGKASKPETKVQEKTQPQRGESRTDRGSDSNDQKTKVALEIMTSDLDMLRDMEKGKQARLVVKRNPDDSQELIRVIRLKV